MNVNKKQILKGVGIIAGVSALAIATFAAIAWYVGESPEVSEEALAVTDEATAVVDDVIDAAA